MKTLVQTLLLVCFTAFFVPALHAQAPVDPKPLEAIIDKALAGYNAGNHAVFYADYAKMMSSIATEPVFKMMYKDQYFTSYGKYVSRTPIKAETVLLGDSPLLVYAAEFEKNKKVKISVNFTKEGGAFKIMQIQFGPM
jgi:hypothetical protein